MATSTDGGAFSVTRSGEKATPPIARVGQLYTDSVTGVTFRVDQGDVEYAPGDTWSFACFGREEELDGVMDRWVDQYVKWIISREERERFAELRTPDEKLGFIESFWRRRDPTPGTPDNERRSEHQRRFAYASRHFGAGMPGWSTDRGKIYILLGPPHAIERNPAGRTSFERPSEVWTYNNPPNPRLPASLDVAFVDFTATGRYEIVSAGNLDILAPLRTNIGYAMSELEAIGLLRSGGEIMEQTTGVRTPVDPTRLATQQFDFQRDLREIERVPERTLPDFREVVQAAAVFPSLPLVLQASQFPLSSDQALAPLTLALPYARLTPEPATDADFRFRARLLVQVRGPSEDASQTLEDLIEVQVPKGELAGYRENQLIYETSLLLAPGRYEVDAYLSDEPSGAIGKASLTLEVDGLAREGLQTSSLLLGSAAIELPSGAEESRAPFQFGNVRLVPNTDSRFESGSSLTAYFQVYGFRSDANEGGARLRVEFFFFREGKLFSKVAASHHRPGRPERTAVKSEISLKEFPRGGYRLLARVTDELTGLQVEREAPFEVVPAGGRRRSGEERPSLR
jgi:GWxTD domain-containing protein